jgi:hypothetical protein
MKKQTLIFGFLLTFFTGFAQTENIAGIWEGSLTINTLQPLRIINFSIQLKQSGTAVWGIYTYGDGISLDSCDCAGKFTSRLSKKDNPVMLMFQDGVIAHNYIPVELCTSLNFLQVYYSKTGEDEFLKGKWFESPLNNLAPDGASGSFVLQKVTGTKDIDIDKYFPKLEQLKKKFQLD